MSERRLEKRQIVPFILMWAASAVLSVGDWLALRAAVGSVAAAIAASVSIETQMRRNWFLRWPAATVDKFALACFGILAVSSIISFEWVYHSALVEGVGKKRFATVAGIQVGLIVVSGIAISIASWVAR
ncbi:MAG TPA: hypothetical protein VM366_04540 [Anaerolineae bacterium]|nr:hypothetical protein [Anaerolineae bacterium]